MSTPRIACLDLDTFFVSVERLLDPRLVGQPVVVGASPGQRGVVTSCSYEVRALGVRSGMPIAEARRLAPHAVYVPTRHDTYGRHAAEVRAVVERWCPVVQTASIDEFFLDFHGCEELYRRPGDADADATIERAIREMRQAIQTELGLPASVGVGTTRPIAKMASGRAKPAGVVMVRAGQERAFVEAMPVRRYPGIGPKAEERLVAAGITTLGELLALPEGPLRDQFADTVARVEDGVGGRRTRLPERDRPAFREHDTPGLAEGSISNEHTFFADIADHQRALDELRALVERVAWRTRKRGVRARTLTLRIRYADFETQTRSRTFGESDEEGVLLAIATDLLRAAWDPDRRIRLLGVGVSHLAPAERQVPLPFGNTRRRPGSAMDAVREKFGYDAIRLGAVRRGSRGATA